VNDKKIINTGFKYGQGDDGTTTAKAGIKVDKSELAVRFYNEFEMWVNRLCVALDFIEPLEGESARIDVFLDVLDYLIENAYVLGAYVYLEDPNKYQWDSSLLEWMKLEIIQLEDNSHNFVAPNPNFQPLEELRLQTRRLESYLNAAIWDLAKPTANESIINRFSSYVYLFENYLRTIRGENMKEVDWSKTGTPEFQPKRSEAKSNNRRT